MAFDEQRRAGWWPWLAIDVWRRDRWQAEGTAADVRRCLAGGGPVAAAAVAGTNRPRHQGAAVTSVSMMQAYRVRHTTIYVYPEAIPVSHNEVRLTPRETANQHCRRCRLAVSPEPATIEKRLDAYDNTVHHFAVQEAHKKLVITAQSYVEVRARQLPELEASPRWEAIRDGLGQPPMTLPRFAAWEFIFESPMVKWPSELKAYAQASFPAGRPLLMGVRELTARIFREFVYDKQATTIATPVAQVFQQRRGVCQDFAHLEIAALRSLGLPARYVSGYLRTIPPPGRPRLVGNDASHAWLSVYCGDLGWVDFDPTNNCVVGTDHITTAWGRDYYDVSPTKGILIGPNSTDLKVEVDVEPWATGASRSAGTNGTGPTATNPTENSAGGGSGRTAPGPTLIASSDPPDLSDDFDDLD